MTTKDLFPNVRKGTLQICSRQNTVGEVLSCAFLWCVIFELGQRSRATPPHPSVESLFELRRRNDDLRHRRRDDDSPKGLDSFGGTHRVRVNMPARPIVFADADI